MGPRALAAALCLAALAGCGGADAPAPAPPPAPQITVRSARDAAAGRLERALEQNINNAAAGARCHRATAADRAIARRSFGGHPRHLFTCRMALRGDPPATFDLSLAGRCFVGHRRDRPIADYGCLRD